VCACARGKRGPGAMSSGSQMEARAAVQCNGETRSSVFSAPPTSQFERMLGPLLKIQLHALEDKLIQQVNASRRSELAQVEGRLSSVEALQERLEQRVCELGGSFAGQSEELHLHVRRMERADSRTQQWCHELDEQLNETRAEIEERLRCAPSCSEAAAALCQEPLNGQRKRIHALEKTVEGMARSSRCCAEETAKELSDVRAKVATVPDMEDQLWALTKRVEELHGHVAENLAPIPSEESFATCFGAEQGPAKIVQIRNHCDEQAQKLESLAEQFVELERDIAGRVTELEENARDAGISLQQVVDLQSQLLTQQSEHGKQLQDISSRLPEGDVQELIAAQENRHANFAQDFDREVKQMLTSIADECHEKLTQHAQEHAQRAAECQREVTAQLEHHSTHLEDLRSEHAAHRQQLQEKDSDKDSFSDSAKDSDKVAVALEGLERNWMAGKLASNERLDGLEAGLQGLICAVESRLDAQAEPSPRLDDEVKEIQSDILDLSEVCKSLQDWEKDMSAHFQRQVKALSETAERMKLLEESFASRLESLEDEVSQYNYKDLAAFGVSEGKVDAKILKQSQILHAHFVQQCNGLSPKKEADDEEEDDKDQADKEEQQVAFRSPEERDLDGLYRQFVEQKVPTVQVCLPGQNPVATPAYQSSATQPDLFVRDLHGKLSEQADVVRAVGLRFVGIENEIDRLASKMEGEIHRLTDVHGEVARLGSSVANLLSKSDDEPERTSSLAASSPHRFAEVRTRHDGQARALSGHAQKLADLVSQLAAESSRMASAVANDSSLEALASTVKQHEEYFKDLRAKLHENVNCTESIEHRLASMEQGSVVSPCQSQASSRQNQEQRVMTRRQLEQAMDALRACMQAIRVCKSVRSQDDEEQGLISPCRPGDAALRGLKAAISNCEALGVESSDLELERAKAMIIGEDLRKGVRFSIGQVTPQRVSIVEHFNLSEKDSEKGSSPGIVGTTHPMLSALELQGQHTPSYSSTVSADATQPERTMEDAPANSDGVSDEEPDGGNTQSHMRSGSERPSRGRADSNMSHLDSDYGFSDRQISTVSIKQQRVATDFGYRLSQGSAVSRSQSIKQDAYEAEYGLSADVLTRASSLHPPADPGGQICSLGANGDGQWSEDSEKDEGDAGASQTPLSAPFLPSRRRTNSDLRGSMRGDERPAEESMIVLRGATGQSEAADAGCASTSFVDFVAMRKAASQDSSTDAAGPSGADGPVLGVDEDEAQAADGHHVGDDTVLIAYSAVLQELTGNSSAATTPQKEPLIDESLETAADEGAINSTPSSSSPYSPSPAGDVKLLRFATEEEDGVTSSYNVEVPVKRESLTPSNCFILLTGHAIYTWIGDECSTFKSEACRAEAERLSLKHSGALANGLFTSRVCKPDAYFWSLLESEASAPQADEE